METEKKLTGLSSVKNRARWWHLILLAEKRDLKDPLYFSGARRRRDAVDQIRFERIVAEESSPDSYIHHSS